MHLHGCVGKEMDMRFRWRDVGGIVAWLVTCVLLFKEGNTKGAAWALVMLLLTIMSDLAPNSKLVQWSFIFGGAGATALFLVINGEFMGLVCAVIIGGLIGASWVIIRKLRAKSAARKAG